MEGDFDLLAASLRADLRDFTAFFEALAVKLEGALPGLAVVKRRSQGFLSRQKRVVRITVDCGDERYQLDYNGHEPSAKRSFISGGIALRSDLISIEEWGDGLARWVAEEATRSDQGRHALQKMLG